MTQKEIVIFYPSFERGGATANLINIINFLLSKNFNIFLFSQNVDKKKFTQNKKLKIISLKKKFNKNSSRIFINFLFFFKLFNFLRQNKTLLVLSMQSHLISIVVAKILRKKIIIRLSEDPIGATIYSENKLNSYLVLLGKIILYNFCDGIVAISSKTKASLLKFVKKKKIKLIYNPYINKILPNKKLTPKNNTCLFIGRFVHQKNIFMLLDVIHKINYINKINLKLIILGKGPLKNLIKKKIIYLNLQNICSVVTWSSNVDKYYKQAKFLILPSFYEGLPNVLIDATNHRVPILATNVSGVSDILLNGKGGFISKINKESLKNKVLFILRNYNLAIKKSNYAKKKIRRFEVNRNCKKYLKFINDFI